jgi:hypothetical protein
VKALSQRAMIAILTTVLGGRAAAADVPTPLVPSPLIRPLSMKVALCVTPLLRAAHLQQVKRQVRLEAGDPTPGREPTWQLGNAAVSALSTAMGAAFTDVMVLDACSPESVPPRDVVAMLIPELVSAESLVSGSKRTVAEVLFRHAHVDLRITLRSAKNTSAVTWEVVGVANIRHGPWGGNSEEVIGRALSEALLSGCARFIADLYLRPEIHEWLMAQSRPDKILK